VGDWLVGRKAPPTATTDLRILSSKQLRYPDNGRGLFMRLDMSRIVSAHSAKVLACRSRRCEPMLTNIL